MTPLRAPILLAVAALAACGGTSPVYTRDATQGCLSGSPLVQSVSASRDDLDFIAMSAPAGGLYVRLGNRQGATISFERNAADAKDAEASYKAVGSSGGLLERRGNTVVSWEETPTDAERALVDGCLKS